MPQRRRLRWTVAAVACMLAVLVQACADQPSASPPVVSPEPSPLTVAPASTTIAASTTSTSVTTASTTTSTTTTTLVLPADRPLRVMVIGDSVALTMTSKTSETHDVPGFGTVEVLNVGNLACPVIEEGEWWFADGIDLNVPAECVGPERYEAEIEVFQPDVVYALFGWTGGGGGQRLPDGSLVAPCDPEFDDRWRAGYQRLIDRLDQSVTVVISTVAPADIDVEGHDVRTRCLNTIVWHLDAVVFDYGDWLCPDGDCSASSHLRADKVHFTDDETLRRGVTTAILAEVLPIAGY